MEIKNKLYPYPVLAYFSDEYKNTSSFKIITNIKIEVYREIVLSQQTKEEEIA